MSLPKTLQRKVTLYDKGIIQRKDTDWQTLSIFFCLFWNFFRANRRYPVFAGAFHTGSGICTFHPFPVPAFSLRYYRKIAQCVLFCLYLCAKADYPRFMNATARIALRLVSDSLKTQPVFLCIDDTMVPKSGTKFADVSKLFDHAAHAIKRLVGRPGYHL